MIDKRSVVGLSNCSPETGRSVFKLVRFTVEENSLVWSEQLEHICRTCKENLSGEKLMSNIIGELARLADD